MIIDTKFKMYKHLKKSLFGNTNKFYKKLSEIPDNETVVVRWNQLNNMKRCYHSILKKEIIKLNIDINEVTICKEPENDSICIFNAELIRNQYGLNLRYKIGIMWMRPAMKNPDRAIGLKAKKLAYYDVEKKDWVVEKIEYLVHVGPSSQTDKLLATSFKVE